MKFTARDHAYVYGVIAQELMAAHPDAEGVLAECIKVYGLQRGSRMGQTADAFGDPRTMQSYLAYGEWAPAPGEMDVRVPESSPSAVWNVHKCPWNLEWAQRGMLDVGKVYCKYVDRELVHGFNPDLKLGTGAIQTDGDQFCYFKWNGADMTDLHKAENAAISEKLGTVRLKPWSYHMAHIYKTMGEVVEKRLGAETRHAVYERADKRIADHYDLDTVELMHAGLVLDYWVTPSLKPIRLLHKLFEA